MTDVDLGDVVEVLDPHASPSMCQLRFSENLDILPTVPH